MVPSWLVTQVLIGVARFLPTQKLVPSQDLGDLAVRDTKKKKLVRISLFSVINQHSKIVDSGDQESDEYRIREANNACVISINCIK